MIYEHHYGVCYLRHFLFRLDSIRSKWYILVRLPKRRLKIDYEFVRTFVESFKLHISKAMRTVFDYGNVIQPSDKLYTIVSFQKGIILVCRSTRAKQITRLRGITLKLSPPIDDTIKDVVWKLGT